MAATHYSFMGYQADLTAWQEIYVPEVARRLQQESVDGVPLTPV